MTATPQDLRHRPPNGGANARAVPPERVDILFRMGRLYLFLPFSALCIAAAFDRHYIPAWVALVPLLLQIATTVATPRKCVGRDAPSMLCDNFSSTT